MTEPWLSHATNFSSLLFPSDKRVSSSVAFQYFHLYRFTTLRQYEEEKKRLKAAREEALVCADENTLLHHLRLVSHTLESTLGSRVLSSVVISFSIVKNRLNFPENFFLCKCIETQLQHATRYKIFVFSLSQNTAMAETSGENISFIKNVRLRWEKTSPKEGKLKTAYSSTTRRFYILFVAQSKSIYQQKHERARRKVFNTIKRGHNLYWRSLWMSCCLFTMYEMLKIYLVFFETLTDSFHIGGAFWPKSIKKIRFS